jgi:hypothetical protein
MFCFEEKGAEVIAGEDFFNLEKQYYETYEKSKVNLFHRNQPSFFTQNLSGNVEQLSNGNMEYMDLDFFYKLSVFLKVSSGTYTLTKSVEEDSNI